MGGGRGRGRGRGERGEGERSGDGKGERRGGRKGGERRETGGEGGERGEGEGKEGRKEGREERGGEREERGGEREERGGEREERGGEEGGRRGRKEGGGGERRPIKETHSLNMTAGVGCIHFSHPHIQASTPSHSLSSPIPTLPHTQHPPPNPHTQASTPPPPPPPTVHSTQPISLAHVREPQLPEALGQVVCAGRLHTHSHSCGTVGVSKLQLPCVNEVPGGRDIVAHMSLLAGWKRNKY